MPEKNYLESDSKFQPTSATELCWTMLPSCLLWRFLLFCLWWLQRPLAVYWVNIPGVVIIMPLPALYYLLGSGKRGEWEQKWTIWYRMFYAMLLFRWKKWLSLRARHELECRGLMRMSSLPSECCGIMNHLKNQWEDPQAMGNCCLVTCSSRTMGRTVGSVYEHAG